MGQDDTGGSGDTSPGLPRNVRHDLRSSIGQVIGYSEIWLDDLEEESAVADIEGLRRDLVRLKAAGRQILDVVNEYIDPVGPRARNLEAPPQATAAEVPHPRQPAQIPQHRIDAGHRPDAATTHTDTPDHARLLVVDDSEANRALLLRRLARKNRSLTAAETGQEALNLLENEPFDLVLLDIMMPEMDGFAVLKQMKAHAALRHLPVIMISALDELDGVIRCIKLGADDYLTKPFDPILLEARIGACLEKKRLRDREMRLFAQLEESFGRLSALERLRDDLTQLIVHDLRTPLTSLLVGLKTLDYSPEIKATDREILSLSITGGETLLGMINDLLDIGKMEDGSLKLERAPIPPTVLVADAVQQVSALALEKDLTVSVELEPDLPDITVDADKLRRTLVNLLGNAVKFTPEGGRITISGASLPAEAVARFSVRDTGEGIPPEEFGHIFEKFGQVSSRKAGRKMSTGLGLTFCKMIVEAHGGRIWVESEPGQGSKFFFTMPIFQG